MTNLRQRAEAVIRQIFVLPSGPLVGYQYTSEIEAVHAFAQTVQEEEREACARQMDMLAKETERSCFDEAAAAIRQQEGA